MSDVPSDPGLEPAQHVLASSVAEVAAQHPDVALTLEVARGTPAECLLALADSMDLVVVGHHERGTWGRFTHGSVAVAVLEHASVAIAVVPVVADSLATASLTRCRRRSFGPSCVACGPVRRWRSRDQAGGSPRKKGTIMKAAVVTDFTKPLEIQDRPSPTPGRGQVLVRIEASGLCHTDIHAAHGDWPVKPTPPFVPGHEGVGIVERLGEGVTDRRRRARRDAVARPRVRSLRLLHQRLGDAVRVAAEHRLLDRRQLRRVRRRRRRLRRHGPRRRRPPGRRTADLRRRHDVQGGQGRRTSGPTEKVAIFGIGGLGHLAVQYATIVGGTVIAVDVDDTKLELARDLGADHVVNAGTTDPVAAIEALGGCDVAIVLAVIPQVFEQAFASLRRGGRLVCVGLPPETDGPMALPIFPTVLKGISVIGSIVGTRQDLAEVFALHALGRTRVVAESRKLDEVNAAIDDVLARPRHRAPGLRVLSA